MTYKTMSNKLNIGARNAKAYDFDVIQAQNEASIGTVSDEVWTMLERESNEAIEWFQSRGSQGDGTNILENLREIRASVQEKDERSVVYWSFKLLSGRMHPTARDICGNVAKQAIYNLCGKRAHKYEVTTSELADTVSSLGASEAFVKLVEIEDSECRNLARKHAKRAVRTNEVPSMGGFASYLWNGDIRKAWYNADSSNRTLLRRMGVVSDDLVGDSQ